MSKFKENLIKAKQDLNQAQTDLITDRMDVHKMEKEKYTEEVIKYNELEDKMFMQKVKVDRLMMGGVNNLFLHASIQTKHKAKSMRGLHKTDGTLLQSHLDIMPEVMEFYGKLMGKGDNSLTHFDIEEMRYGNQLNMEQIQFFASSVTEEKIVKAFKGIGDMKAFGVDGYGARFFKVRWHTIKNYVIKATKEFFDCGRIFREFNNIVVTLIPKNGNARSVEENIPIDGCTTFYKIISRILTDRLGKVLDNIINPCQTAFVPGENIHNNILLAYELFKGYNRK